MLIVNNSSEQKKILLHAVENSGLSQLEHIASNGTIALERLKQSPIDVILLKVPLSDTNTVRIVERIKNESPGVFVILTGASAATIKKTIHELKSNAIDYILLPETELPGSNKIQSQLHGLFAQIITRQYTEGIYSGQLSSQTDQVQQVRIKQLPALTTQVVSVPVFTKADLVVIAASTGGPNALEYIFKNLPSTFNKPILVVQHTLPEFTKNLVMSLNKKSSLPVVEGKEGDSIKPGQITLAPGGVHMTVIRNKSQEEVIKLEPSPPVNGTRPAADVLFSSLAKTYKGKQVMAVILTGMGNDGLAGVIELKEHCTCYCLTQSEKTCVVYGMPKIIVDAGLADKVENLELIPNRILEITSGRSY